MLLKEFIYYDKNNLGVQDDGRYEADRDVSVLHNGDMRKTPRLTLEIINRIRKAGESREKEKKEELGLVRKMYATPPPEAAA